MCSFRNPIIRDLLISVTRRVKSGQERARYPYTLDIKKSKATV